MSLFTEWLSFPEFKIFAAERGVSAINVAVTAYNLTNAILVTDNLTPYLNTVVKDRLVNVNKLSQVAANTTIICQVSIDLVQTTLLTELIKFSTLLILPYGFSTTQVALIIDFFQQHKQDAYLLYGIEPRLINFYVTRTNLQMHEYQRNIYLQLTKGVSSPVRRRFTEDITLKTLQAGNFAYPPFKGGIQFYGTPIDKPETEGGWMTYEKLAQLSEYSEKFNYIVKTLDQNKNTVILTQFQNQYGSQLLASLLKLYRNITPIMLEYTQTAEQIAVNVDKFNSNGGILIMNPVQIPKLLQKVSTIMVMEGNKLEILNYLVGIVVNNTNYNTETDVDMILLASVVSENRNTTDADFYEEFETQEQDQKRAWLELTANGLTLRLIDDELVVN